MMLNGSENARRPGPEARSRLKFGPLLVPCLYVTPRSITDTMMEHWKKIKDKLMSGNHFKEKPQLEKYKLRDTFVFTSYTTGSISVLGQKSQYYTPSYEMQSLQ